MLPVKTHISTLLVTSDGTLYSSGNKGGLVSQDRGDTWENCSAGPDNTVPSVGQLIMSSSGVLYAAAGAVYVSHDSARSWKRISKYGDIRGIGLASDGRLVAGFELEGIYGTYDEGKTWQALYTSGTSDFFQMLSMTTSPDGTVYVGVIRPHLILQVVNNSSYCKRYELPEEGDVADQMICDWERNMYVFSSPRVYRVSLTNWQWEEISEGLNNAGIGSFAFDSNRVLYAGTVGRGIYRTTTPTFVREDSTVAYSTLRVLPNPVDVQSSVTVVVPASMRGRQVHCVVTDVLGQKIALPILSGDSSFEISTEKIVAGTYYVSLITGMERLSGKLVVVP